MTACPNVFIEAHINIYIHFKSNHICNDENVPQLTALAQLHALIQLESAQQYEISSGQDWRLADDWSSCTPMILRANYCTYHKSNEHVGIYNSQMKTYQKLQNKPREAISELSTGHFSWTRPDPTQRNVDPTRPAIADKKSDPTRPDPRPNPSPICTFFDLIIIY